MITDFLNWAGAVLGALLGLVLCFGIWVAFIILTIWAVRFALGPGG